MDKLIHEKSIFLKKFITQRQMYEMELKTNQIKALECTFQ